MFQLCLTSKIKSINSTQSYHIIPSTHAHITTWNWTQHKNVGLQFLASGSFDFTWNPHEIWQISGEIHPKPYKSKCFNQNYSVWWMQERGYDPGFHEICTDSYVIYQKWSSENDDFAIHPIFFAIHTYYWMVGKKRF